MDVARWKRRDVESRYPLHGRRILLYLLIMQKSTLMAAASLTSPRGWHPAAQRASAGEPAAISGQVERCREHPAAPGDGRVPEVFEIPARDV